LYWPTITSLRNKLDIFGRCDTSSPLLLGERTDESCWRLGCPIRFNLRSYTQNETKMVFSAMENAEDIGNLLPVYFRAFRVQRPIWPRLQYSHDFSEEEHEEYRRQRWGNKKQPYFV